MIGRIVEGRPTFLLDSFPGGPDSSFGMASRRPRTRSGGVRGFVLKKFIGRYGRWLFQKLRDKVPSLWV